MSGYFDSYAEGLIYASACTDLDDAAATARMNRESPTGIGAPWRISTDPTFANGSPHPCPCPDDASRRHVLFEC